MSIMSFIRQFIGASVLFILVEIGGIIAVNIINIDMEDIVERGWLELNQHMRNLIQSNVSIQLIPHLVTQKLILTFKIN